MARTPKQPAPSAMDGYRRLNRTTSVRGSGGVAAIVGVTRPSDIASVVAPAATRRPRRGRRVAGGLRLAGFGAVIALIVGTSVALAGGGSIDSPAKRRSATAAAPATFTADPAKVSARRDTAKAPVAGAMMNTKAATPHSAVAKTSPATKSSVIAKAAAADTTRVVSSTATQAAASPVIARRAAAGAELPFSGERELSIVLLAGSVLMLLGMLTQIAGQPLPASSASSRTRRASRTT